VGGRGELHVAIALGLYDGRVHPERGVVDEHAIAYQAEIDPTLQGRVEGVQRANDVGPVEAKIEREVVAGPGGHDDQGNVVRPGDVRDQRLRAVAASHAQHIGTLVDGPLGQRPQVITGVQDNWRDPSAARLRLQP
jgi:hypothetical protein